MKNIKTVLIINGVLALAVALYAIAYNTWGSEPSDCLTGKLGACTPTDERLLNIFYFGIVPAAVIVGIIDVVTLIRRFPSIVKWVRKYTSP